VHNVHEVQPEKGELREGGKEKEAGAKQGAQSQGGEP
jgi:hypothetical protein